MRRRGSRSAPLAGDGTRSRAGTVSAMSANETSTLSPRMLLILEAATRVVASRGMRGLTHRAVDAEAGLAVLTRQVGYAVCG